MLLASISLTLVLAAGVALAATVNCTAGVDCVGTPNPDTINGSIGADDMYGRAGADVMKGNEGNDSLQGGRGADHLGGGEGRDILWGGSELGNGPLDNSVDVVHGGLRADYIYSGFAQGGVDRVFGDRGNDIIEAEKAYGYPKTKDVVDCGPGDDTVYFDKGLDEIKNCERRRPDQKPPVME
jgi:Ca2+-binding RTX toxin-like protein